MSDSDRSRELALFRFGLIVDLVHLPRETKGMYARLEEKVQETYTYPTLASALDPPTHRHPDRNGAGYAAPWRQACPPMSCIGNLSSMHPSAAGGTPNAMPSVPSFVLSVTYADSALSPQGGLWFTFPFFYLPPSFPQSR